MTDDLSLTFAALLELAEPFKLSLPAVSKHLKVLHKAGLITQGRRAQWRPCRLEPLPLKGVAEWIDHYRQSWEARFGRLGDYLRELSAPQEDSTGPRLITSWSTPASSPTSTCGRAAAFTTP